MTSNQLKTLRRVKARPGIPEAAVGANHDVAGCIRAGLLTRREVGGVTTLHLTARGRAALTANRTRVRSGAFR